MIVVKKHHLIKSALFSVAVAALSGCSLAPGMHYQEDGVWKELTSSDEAKVIEDKVVLVRLTPKMVALQERPTAQLPDVLRDYKPDDYRIGVYDALQVVVWDHPEITMPAATSTVTGANSRIVKSDGTIFVPYVGELQLAGMTLGEARSLIATKLARYIESPQVDLTVVEYASQHFSVNGEVANPGRMVITAKPITLVDGIGIAGGFSPTADRRKVALVRDGKRHELDMIALAEQGVDLTGVFLKNGDMVHVPDNTDYKAYVIGEVNRPKAVEFSYKGLTLTEALGEVGGVSQLFSDASDVFVVRSADETGRKASVYHLDAGSPVALVVADKFALQPRDVVFVGAADVTRWNRVISQLLPSLTVVKGVDDLKDE